MAWRRGRCTRDWLARLLAIAFVVSSGITVAGSSAGAETSTPALGATARLLPSPSAALGSLNRPDAVAVYSGAAGSTTLHRPDVSSSAQLAAPPARGATRALASTLNRAAS